MTQTTNGKPPRPIPPRTLLALLISAALAASLSRPASAEPVRNMEVRVAVSDAQLRDPRSLARTRRQIAVAAHALCDSGSVAALYRDGARRCRQSVIADGERQLEQRLAVRPATGAIAISR